MLLLPSEVLADVVAWCRLAHPAEACGIIAGPAGQPATGVAVADRVVPMANLSPTPGSAFEFAPGAQVAAYRDMDARGEDPVVLWHSHPSGPPVMSPVDQASAVGDSNHWLIVSLRSGRPEFGCWRIVDGQAVEDELRVVDRDRSAAVPH